MHTIIKIAVVGAGLLLVGAARGHEGPVDSYGCHQNIAHGTYHCHSGPLAQRQFRSQAQMLRVLKEREIAGRPKPKLAPTGF